MIVADTNVIAGLVYGGDWSASAEKLFAADAEWAAPLLWRSELRNLLTTQVRTGRIGLADALDMMETAESLLAGREFSVDSGSVLRLAAESRCTAYDCEFVALARYLGVKLVTLDRQLVAAFPETAIDLEARSRRRR